jgi:hypothetical protein
MPIASALAVSLKIVDVFSLGATNFCPFLRGNVHFQTRKKRNYPRVQNQHALAKDTAVN